MTELGEMKEDRDEREKKLFIPPPASRIQPPESRIQNLESRIQQPTSVHFSTPVGARAGRNFFGR